MESVALTDPEYSADRGQGTSLLMLSFFGGWYGEGVTQAWSPEGPAAVLSLGLAPAFPLPPRPDAEEAGGAQSAGWGFLPVGPGDGVLCPCRCSPSAS